MEIPSVFKLINFWPPFLVSGIRVKKYLPELKRVEVEMKLRLWNKNHERAHFGGSLYAMTDPFYALLIQENLPPGHEVWVKSADIQFKRPGRGRVEAHFQLSDTELDRIKNQLENDHKAEPQFSIRVQNESGETVAEVKQTVHVRRRRPSQARRV